MATPRNIKELRDEMLEMFALAKADPRRSVQCDALANIAGKAIGTLKIELEDCAARGVQPNIAFLQYGQKEIPLRPPGLLPAGK